MAQAIRLLMQDAEDLEVVAAHLQDSVLHVGDMRYLPGERRFVVMLNRFCWEDAARKRLGPFKRVRAGLHFDDVTAVKVRNIRTDARDDVLELLTIFFEAREAPAGTVVLVFAGDAMIRLDVDCIEGAVADIGEPWTTLNRPRHEDPAGMNRDAEPGKQ